MYVGKVVFLRMLKSEKGKGRGVAFFCDAIGEEGVEGRKKRGGFALSFAFALSGGEKALAEKAFVSPRRCCRAEEKGKVEGGGDLSERCLASPRVFLPSSSPSSSSSSSLTAQKISAKRRTLLSPLFLWGPFRFFVRRGVKFLWGKQNPEGLRGMTSKFCHPPFPSCPSIFFYLTKLLLPTGVSDAREGCSTLKNITHTSAPKVTVVELPFL